MRWRRGLAPGLALCLLLGLTGCTSFGTDVEGLLRPPQATGEQGRIEAALGAYIASTLTQENYVLRYPQSGDYRSAFVVEDLDGDGNEEALAFYRLGAENGFTHINLLHQSNGEWVSVNDFESAGSDIESVTLGDMDGDGVRELFVCWDMYSSRTYQLSIYELTGNRVAEFFSGACAQVTVGDLTGDGRDNCLLFNMETDALTASLWAVSGSGLEELGQTVVDAAVQQLRMAHVVPLTAERNGVFVDCLRSSDCLVTELVCWDGSRLVAPFYDSETGGNPQTGRAPDIPSGDMDEDGMWEWPVCEPLASYADAVGAAADTTRWHTTFYSWDPVSSAPVEKFSCVYNAADGYYLMIDREIPVAYTTSYIANGAVRTLWIYAADTSGAAEPLLAVRTTLKGADAKGEEGFDFQSILSGETADYSVWYPEENPYQLTIEKLQYMLIEV